MCTTEACLGYFLISIILFFTVLIFGLLKFRKKQLKEDLSMSSSYLWNESGSNFFKDRFKPEDFLFSVWQDKSSSMSFVAVKNFNDELIGRVEFPIGAREYKMYIGDQLFRIVVNLVWGGTSLSLYSPDNKELARLERKSLSPMKHKIDILDLGSLQSSQPIFSLIAPITYSFKGNPIAMTRFISPVRRVGRMGCFSKEISLPIKLFVLCMTS